MGFHEFLNCSFYYTGPVYTIYPIIQSVSSLEILVSNDSTFCWSFKFSALSPSIIASLTFDKQSLTISYMFFVRSYLKLTNWLLMFWNFSSIEPHRAAKDWVNQVLVSWILLHSFQSSIRLIRHCCIKIITLITKISNEIKINYS